MKLEPVKPITTTKVRYTRHSCGVCGDRVGFDSDVCKGCGTPIDWSGFYGMNRRKKREIPVQDKNG